MLRPPILRQSQAGMARRAFALVASEAPVPTVGASKHPSHRLRKNRTFGRASGRKPASAPRGAAGSLITQHPVASLLIAAGVGYVLARL